MPLDTDSHIVRCKALFIFGCPVFLGLLSLRDVSDAYKPTLSNCARQANDERPLPAGTTRANHGSRDDYAAHVAA
jgi:hypothetical protein